GHRGLGILLFVEKPGVHADAVFDHEVVRSPRAAQLHAVAVVPSMRTAALAKLPMASASRVQLAPASTRPLQFPARETAFFWTGSSQTSAALALQGDGMVVLATTSSNWVKGGYQPALTVPRFEADSDTRPTRFGSEAAFRKYSIEQAVRQYQWQFGQVYKNWYNGPLGAGLAGAGAPVQATGDTGAGKTFS